ncbi:malonate--CoA ligase ACSF3, mitochondrial-like [Hydractinia symbiolongicarpus]|uniref:malonate--CoA ligase ACSF3, mitochondrial-like n=1 Tax=Hydractinia symbiolongicarpus TaxID=13093 RepID=UPI00254AB78F|nr:malonate--CoA ligase ACSF3, mitochondrial-like [Hydractinia symbiolongicarpus]
MLLQHAKYITLKLHSISFHITGTKKMLHRTMVIPPFLRVIQEKYQDKLAIRDSYGVHTYEDILTYSKLISQNILTLADKNRQLNHKTGLLSGERIAFLCSNDVMYTSIQWAIWMSGGMAVPLAKSHPQSELDYVINDSQASLILSNTQSNERILPLAKKYNLHTINIDGGLFKDITEKHLLQNYVRITGLDSDINIRKDEAETFQDKWSAVDWEKRNAMLIYTSGTTGRPKGVVVTFSSLQAQIKTIVDTWGMTSSDVTLHVLPLHHVHGVVNALACPLWSGGSCLMLSEFAVEKVWNHLLQDDNVNVFHAVPTIYVKLIEHYKKNFTSAAQRNHIRKRLQEKMRVMISGSAALPQPILNKWKEITGHVLLERYGMTEIGMALTNPLEGKRTPGAVGKPFPTVEVKLMSADNKMVVQGDSKQISVNSSIEEKIGQLFVKGPSVFKEYWNKPEATQEVFNEDGWFMTGDTVMYDEENCIFRILGRTSVDIVNSGGYKISTLDIERHFLSHDKIKEVAVVGLPDETWGQLITAIVVLNEDCFFSLEEMHDWAKDKMASYHIPKKLKIVDSIPRNAMGKVNKKELIQEMFSA